MRRSALGERRPARARRDPRLRLLAARPRGARGHRAAAVAVVGARDGRSGARRSTRSGRDVAVTYAEAGGWGRALVARVPAARHSARRPAARLHLPPLAELPPRAGRDGRRSRAIRADRGFPRPTADAALRRATRRGTCDEPDAFRPSARRDRQPAPRRARRATRRALSPEAIERARARGRRRRVDGARARRRRRSARRGRPAGARSTPCAAMPDVQLAIKTASGRNARRLRGGRCAARPNIRVLPAGAAGAAARAPAAPSSRSTRPWRSTPPCSGVPALVIGLPNNLSPFVDAGHHGRRGRTPAKSRAALDRILYDEEFRQQIDARAAAFLARFSIGRTARRPSAIRRARC